MSRCFPPIRTSVLGFKATCITQAALPKARSLTQSRLPRLFPQRRSHYRIWGSGCRNMHGGVTRATLGCQHSGSCRAVVLGPRCTTLSCPPSRCESRSGGACAQDHRGPPRSAAPCWTPQEWRQVDREVATQPTGEHRATDAGRGAGLPSAVTALLGWSQDGEGAGPRSQGGAAASGAIQTAPPGAEST